MRVCSVHGCANLYPTSQGSRCPAHRAEADKRRGTATQRGYTGKGHQTFRTAVLTRDPICTNCHMSPSTAADHYPLSRKQLLVVHVNPNDPARGRGLCAPCHNTSTAHEQPGGWNQPD